MSKHQWNTVNREVLQPEELSTLDLVDEIEVALVGLSEPEITRLAQAIDRGYYISAGNIICNALRASGRINR